MTVLHTFSFPGGRELRVRDDGRFDLYSDGWQLFSFPVASRLNCGEAEDYDRAVTFEGDAAETGCTHLTWRAENANWTSKRYHVRVYSDHATFQIEVTGQGAPREIVWFGGMADRRAIEYYTAGYMVPQFQDVDHERAKQLSSCEGTLLPLRAAPPPFVLPFWSEYNDDWAGIGFAAPAGQNNYERVIWKTENNNRGRLIMPLLGYTEIDGTWLSPLCWFGFARDGEGKPGDMEVVHAYAEWCFNDLGYPRYHGSENVPHWWREPILCGWGEQCQLANAVDCDRNETDLACQEVYEKMAARADRLGLHPGTMMIDDKWQKDYGTLEVDPGKWPDLRGFVERQHAKGIHVVLWFRQWIADGLPAELCTIKRHLIATVDPTNPKYLAYLKEKIRYLLSDEPGCMNCDGFKLDFMDCLPREAPGVLVHEKGVYGLEMMRRLFEAVYRFAKEVKPDALINTSAIHPYFADICDQIRLHDFASNTRLTVSMMKYRTALTKAIMPDALIDTDHAHFNNHQEGLHKILADAECGIPVLYSLTPYSDEELATVAKYWDAYRKTI